MNLWKGYLRWRHSKGFGVHSPYAYRFVVDVLRPGPYALYSYDEIDPYLNKAEYHDYRLIKRVKFLLRLINFLKTERIVSSGQIREMELACKASGIPLLLSSEISGAEKLKKGDLVVVDSRETSSVLPGKGIQEGVALFALSPNPEISKLLETPIERGLLMKGKKRLLLIPRPEMAYLSYEVNL